MRLGEHAVGRLAEGVVQRRIVRAQNDRNPHCYSKARSETKPFPFVAHGVRQEQRRPDGKSYGSFGTSFLPMSQRREQVSERLPASETVLDRIEE